jgi:hypothetical protein
MLVMSGNARYPAVPPSGSVRSDNSKKRRRRGGDVGDDGDVPIGVLVDERGTPQGGGIGAWSGGLAIRTEHVSQPGQCLGLQPGDVHLGDGQVKHGEVGLADS